MVRTAEYLALQAPNATLLELNNSQEDNKLLRRNLSTASEQLQVAGVVHDLLIVRVCTAETEIKRLQLTLEKNESLTTHFATQEANQMDSEDAVCMAEHRQDELRMQLAEALENADLLRGDCMVYETNTVSLNLMITAGVSRLGAVLNKYEGLRSRLTESEAEVLRLQAAATVNKGLQEGLTAAHSDNEKLQSMEANEVLTARLAIAETAALQLPTLKATIENLIEEKNDLEEASKVLTSRLNVALATADGLNSTAATAEQLAIELRNSQDAGVQMQVCSRSQKFQYLRQYINLQNVF